MQKKAEVRPAVKKVHRSTPSGQVPRPHGGRMQVHRWTSKRKWWLAGRWGRWFNAHPTTLEEGAPVGTSGRMTFRGPLCGAPPDHVFFCGAPGCTELVHLIWHPNFVVAGDAYKPDAWRNGTFVSIASSLCPTHEGDPELQRLMRCRTAAYNRRAAAKLKARQLAEKRKTPAQKARERRERLKLPVHDRPMTKRQIARFLKTRELPGDLKREATAVSPGILVSAGRGRRGKSVLSEVLAGAEVRS